MTTHTRKRNTVRKRLLIIGLLIVVAIAGVYFYYATEKYADTAGVNADYTLEANAFIDEFENNLDSANKKYTEKIITVSGIISDLEAPDSTTVNVIFLDTSSGARAIFAFQEQHLKEASNLKTGDQVTIKGSCSGGSLDGILEIIKIEFKRIALITTKK